MTIREYCGNIEFSSMQFVFSLTEQIREKITRKELTYKEQIIRYVKKQVEHYFNSFQLKKAVIIAHKNEVYNSVMFKLQTIFKEYHVFQCL